MSRNDPNLTRQPATLDPNVEIPDEAPLGQSQTEDEAADFREAHEEHKEQVKAEREQEVVGPRKPGDHAGSESDEGSDDGTEGSPTGTVEEVKAWVGDDRQRAQTALTAEREGQNRSTLVAWLEEKAA